MAGMVFKTSAVTVLWSRLVNNLTLCILQLLPSVFWCHVIYSVKVYVSRVFITQHHGDESDRLGQDRCLSPPPRTLCFLLGSNTSAFTGTRWCLK